MALQSPDQYATVDQSSRALMEKLDELLVDCIPKEIEDVHGVDYITGLNEVKKASANNTKKAENTVIERAHQLLDESQASRTSSAEPFRILSIGCGDGTLDAKILQAMISRHPDVKIDYTGIDIDEEICQNAIVELRVLKTKFNDKVAIRILPMDINSFNSVEIGSPCDLILALHVLYYAKDMRKVLADIHTLLKPESCMFILLTTADYPGMSHLFCRFWLHEHGWPMKLSDAATENLDALGIEYKTELIDGELDFTECFRNGFQKPHQKFFLDFMTHTRLECYPPEIYQLCVYSKQLMNIPP